MNKSALVLIEFQHEWLDESGKLRKLLKDRQLLDRAVQGAKRAVEIARGAGVSVAHVGLRFQPGHSELGKASHGLRASIPQGEKFLIGSKGSEFMSPFMPVSGKFVVAGRFGGSGFTGSHLDGCLRNNSITLKLSFSSLLACCSPAPAQFRR